ncbi:MAG: domain 2 [Pseudomonadota bacterium]|jgi:hypothetical protein
MRWYVSQNGKTSGPFSEQRIAMLVNWGKITSEAYLCDEKWVSWVALPRSQFAPLLGEQQEPVARGLSEPPGAQGGWGQRLALTVLIMLAAGAFLLAVWLSPQVPPGPLGRLSPGDKIESVSPAAHTDHPGTPI